MLTPQHARRFVRGLASHASLKTTSKSAHSVKPATKSSMMNANLICHAIPLLLAWIAQQHSSSPAVNATIANQLSNTVRSAVRTIELDALIVWKDML